MVSGGGTLPDANSSRDACIAACTWLDVGCSPLTTEASSTLRCRSVAARSSALCFAMSIVFVVMPGSAPRASSALTASARFSAAANISGVCPHSCSRAFASAPRSSSSVTTSALPADAARCSGVTPLVVARAATFAPAFNSARTAPALADWLARCSGVYCPMRVVDATFAPA